MKTGSVLLLLMLSGCGNPAQQQAQLSAALLTAEKLCAYSTATTFAERFAPAIPLLHVRSPDRRIIHHDVAGQ